MVCTEFFTHCDIQANLKWIKTHDYSDWLQSWFLGLIAVPLHHSTKYKISKTVQICRKLKHKQSRHCMKWTVFTDLCDPMNPKPHPKKCRNCTHHIACTLGFLLTMGWLVNSTYTTDGVENCQNSVRSLVLSATSYKLSKADLSTMLFLAGLGISNT